MAQYTLTEAYSEVYNPQKVDELFDNLRFIDYMMDEDIEEVVESLVWEFRDYGNTLDESFDLLSFAASDDIICESYDQLVEDILYEATITRGSQRSQFAGSARGMVTSGRGDILAYNRAASKLATKTGRAVAQRQADEAERQAQQRREARRARVDGAISRVKSAMAGSKGGMGRAAKALGGAARKAGSVAAGVAQKGKALLGSLLRKGATAAGKGVYAAGKAIEGRGKQAAQSGLETRRAGKVSRSGQMSLVLEPTSQEKAGGKASAVGRAVRKVGAAIQRMGKSAKPKGTVLDPSTSDVVSTKEAPKTDLPASYHKPITTQRVSGGFDPSKSSSTKQKPTPMSKTGKPLTGAAASVSTRKGRQLLGSQRHRVAPGTTGVRGEKKVVRGGATYDALGRRIREDYDLELLLQYLSEDIISAGYADTIEEAYDVIEDLDENTLSEVLYEYLD